MVQNENDQVLAPAGVVVDQIHHQRRHQVTQQQVALYRQYHRHPCLIQEKRKNRNQYQLLILLKGIIFRYFHLNKLDFML